MKSQNKKTHAWGGIEGVKWWQFFFFFRVWLNCAKEDIALKRTRYCIKNTNIGGQNLPFSFINKEYSNIITTFKKLPEPLFCCSVELFTVATSKHRHTMVKNGQRGKAIIRCPDFFGESVAKSSGCCSCTLMYNALN